MKIKILLAAIIIALVIIVVAVYLMQNNDYYGAEIYHNHADFAVYLNGVQYNFSQEKYMSSENVSLSHNLHLHALDGEIIHIHAPGVKLKDFFRSIGMNFTANCFVLDDGQSFCNNAQSKLLFYVNGRQDYRYGEYESQDLDRILITYGSGYAQQSVSDRACIYSLKCPERGAPPDESCISTKKCVV